MSELSGATQSGADLLKRYAHRAREVFREFWCEPIEAERLALLRIALGTMLIFDQLLQFIPHFSYLFGPAGISPTGYSQTALSKTWELTGLLPAMWLGTRRIEVMGVLFSIWCVLTWLFTIGFKTRWVSVLLWVMTGIVLNRHPALRNAGDNVLMNALFVMMFASSGEALSVDAWRQKRLDGSRKFWGEWQNPWTVRIFQLLLCSLYTGSAFHKLRGGWDGTWLSGTTLYYVFNDFGLTRWPYARLPVPEWILMASTYASLFWELFFIPLVIWRRTRFYTLLFGIGFHLVIYLVVEVGWFSFYCIACYAIWIPVPWLRARLAALGAWWARLRAPAAA